MAETLECTHDKKAINKIRYNHTDWDEKFEICRLNEQWWDDTQGVFPTINLEFDKKKLTTLLWKEAVRVVFWKLMRPLHNWTRSNYNLNEFIFNLKKLIGNFLSNSRGYPKTITEILLLWHSRVAFPSTSVSFWNFLFPGSF